MTSRARRAKPAPVRPGEGQAGQSSRFSVALKNDDPFSSVGGALTLNLQCHQAKNENREKAFVADEGLHMQMDNDESGFESVTPSREGSPPMGRERVVLCPSKRLDNGRIDKAATRMRAHTKTRITPTPPPGIGPSPSSPQDNEKFRIILRNLDRLNERIDTVDTRTDANGK